MQSTKTELLQFLEQHDALRATLVCGKIEDPLFDPTQSVDAFMDLTAKVRKRVGDNLVDTFAVLQTINSVLFDNFHLESKSERTKNVIDDPGRYYLHRVLKAKAASPLAVTLVYCLMLEQIGISHECLAMPSYFLLRLSDITGDFYVDPFDGGRLLTEEEFQRKFKSVMQKHRVHSNSLYERVGFTQLIAKLIQQLKHIYILKGKATEALRAVELLTGLFPECPEHNRDRGILYCEMEYFSKAMEDLRYYISQRPKASDIKEIKKLTVMLKGYREIVN